MASDLLTKINQLSKREKNIIGALLLIFASLPFFYVTFPSWNQYIDSNSKISQSKKKLIEIESQTRRLEKIKGENQSLSQKIDDQKLYLAKTYEVDFLVEDLKKICDESSISLDSFTPSDPEPVNIVLEKQLEGDAGISKTTKLRQVLDKLKGQDLPVDLYRYPIEVRVTGNFTDILELFKKLEKYGRVISVNNISIGKAGTTKQGFDSRLSKAKPKKQEDKSGLIGAFDLVAYSLPSSKEETISTNQLQKNTRAKQFSYTRSRSR